MTMTTMMERDMEASVDRYCEIVDAMEQGTPGVTDYQALYSKAKAEQERFIQLKGNCQRLPTYLATERVRLRFKAAHARMRALEQRLKEQGVILFVPPVLVVLENGEERRLPRPVVTTGGRRRRLPVRYEILFVVFGALIFVTGLLVGLHRAGYL